MDSTLYLDQLREYVFEHIDFTIEERFYTIIVDEFIEHSKNRFFNMDLVTFGAAKKLASRGYPDGANRCVIIVHLVFAYCEKIGWCRPL